MKIALKNKNKNFKSTTLGFTLVELIGVVIILAIIALLAFPPILNSIRKTELQLSDSSKEILYSATDLYVSDNLNDFPKTNGNIFCVSLSTLSSNNYLTTKIYDSVTGEEISLDNKVEVKVEDGKYSYNVNNDCTQYIKTIYLDNSGANYPELLKNMIPIKYDGTNWVYADLYEEWYDYDKKEWANAVVLKKDIIKQVGDIVSESDIDLWYVWIPRYKYRVFNANNETSTEQEIYIVFENNTDNTGNAHCNDAINQTIDGLSVSEVCNYDISSEHYLTHPAFTFGNKELTGFWVGKFEVSTTDSTCNSNKNATNCNKILPVQIKPNVYSWRYANIANYFYSIQNLKNNYSLGGDSHMIKNMEWGAVAYFKQSQYGLGVTQIGSNGCSDYMTGCGNQQGEIVLSGCNAYNTVDGVYASTTGNVYGVYDMSGGTSEYVMGNMVNSDGTFYISSSGFSTSIDEKYYDKYSYNSNSKNFNRGKLGDATKEIILDVVVSDGAWYEGNSFFVFSGNPWIVQGNRYFYGNYSPDIFGFSYSTGIGESYISTRAVITP